MDKLITNRTISTAGVYNPLLPFFTKPLEFTASKARSKDILLDNLSHLLLKGYKATLKIISNYFWWETQFKLLHRVFIPYITPQDSPGEKLCPLCKEPCLTLLHCIWSCPSIAVFWNQVQCYVLGITKFAIPWTASLCYSAVTKTLQIKGPIPPLELITFLNEFPSVYSQRGGLSLNIGYHSNPPPLWQ